MVLISVVFILDLYTKIKLHNLSIRVFRLKNKKERTINATSNEINIEKSDKIIGYLKICIKPFLISKKVNKYKTKANINPKVLMRLCLSSKYLITTKII